MKTNFAILQPGDFLYENQRYRILKVNKSSAILINQNGIKIEVSRKVIENNCYSNSQYTAVKQLSRSEIVDIIAGSSGNILTVNFYKQLHPEDVLQAIKDKSGKDLEKAVKGLHGQERTLVGYLSSPALFGRFQMVDLEAQFKEPDKSPIRLVDQQTINWLIMTGVKYEVK